MTLTEYKENVPSRQQAIIRHDDKGWYAELANGQLWRSQNGSIIRYQFAAPLYTQLQYVGFSPRYE
jgi:hypothetical protein